MNAFYAVYDGLGEVIEKINKKNIRSGIYGAAGIVLDKDGLEKDSLSKAMHRLDQYNRWQRKRYHTDPQAKVVPETALKKALEGKVIFLNDVSNNGTTNVVVTSSFREMIKSAKGTKSFKEEFRRGWYLSPISIFAALAFILFTGFVVELGVTAVSSEIVKESQASGSVHLFDQGNVIRISFVLTCVYALSVTGIVAEKIRRRRNNHTYFVSQVDLRDNLFPYSDSLTREGEWLSTTIKYVGEVFESEEFRDDYRNLLLKSSKHLINAKVVLVLQRKPVTYGWGWSPLRGVITVDKSYAFLVHFSDNGENYFFIPSSPLLVRGFDSADLVGTALERINEEELKMFL